MDIDKFKVTVTFEIAYFYDSRDESKLISGLNALLNETVKIWAKDHRIITSPTKTEMEVV